MMKPYASRTAYFLTNIICLFLATPLYEPMNKLHPTYSVYYAHLQDSRLITTQEQAQRLILTQRLMWRRDFIFRGLPTIQEEDSLVCAPQDEVLSEHDSC